MWEVKETERKEGIREIPCRIVSLPCYPWNWTKSSELVLDYVYTLQACTFIMLFIRTFYYMAQSDKVLI